MSRNISTDAGGKRPGRQELKLRILNRDRMPIGQLERDRGGTPLGCHAGFLFDGCLISIWFPRTLRLPSWREQSEDADYRPL